MSKKSKTVLLIFEIIVVLALLVGVVFYQRQVQARESAAIGAEEQARRYVPYLTYQGQNYPLKRNLTSMLLIGTDHMLDEEKQADYQAGFYNLNVADFLVLLVFDNMNKTVTPFQICRDSMCKIRRFDLNGNPLDDYRVAQICLSHTVGTGKEDSCEIVVETVENLLYNAPVDYYMSFTMDAVPLINDLVGGVEVTLDHDIPALGKEYVKGATILLKGKNALKFVRYRNTDLLDDNLSRMANHRVYMDGFTVAARTAASQDPELAGKIFKTANRFLCTNLSVENVQALVNKLVEYEILPAVYFDGQYAHPETERFAGYYVDEASVWSCVQSVFCQS